MPAGIVGARLYHVVTSWSELPDAWWGPLAVWRGGLGVWGGIAAGTLAGILVLRRRGADVPRFLDAAAPGLLVAQAIGRVGNWFNQELYGPSTGLPWGLEIDASNRSAVYADAATFHPCSCTRCCGTSASPGHSSGSVIIAARGRGACSPCTSPATR